MRQRSRHTHTLAHPTAPACGLLQEKMGAPWAAWSVAQNRFAPVAAYTKRTIRDVRQKVKEKLSLPEVAAAAAAGEHLLAKRAEPSLPGLPWIWLDVAGRASAPIFSLPMFFASTRRALNTPARRPASLPRSQPWRIMRATRSRRRQQPTTRAPTAPPRAPTAPPPPPLQQRRTTRLWARPRACRSTRCR